MKERKKERLFLHLHCMGLLYFHPLTHTLAPKYRNCTDLERRWERGCLAILTSGNSTPLSGYYSPLGLACYALGLACYALRLAYHALRVCLLCTRVSLLCTPVSLVLLTSVSLLLTPACLLCAPVSLLCTPVSPLTVSSLYSWCRGHLQKIILLVIHSHFNFAFMRQNLYSASLQHFT